MSIKNLLSIKTKFYIKNIKNIIFGQKKCLIPNGKSRIFFLDAADYGNIGDLAIRKSINDFIIKNTDSELIVFDSSKVVSFIKCLKKNIKPDDIIVLTGGGNMGTLYPKYEGLRRYIISKFKKNKIIIFPVTVDYGNDKKSIKEKNKAYKLFSKRNNLIISVREKKSYEYMKKNFNNKIIFCPDIVLSHEFVDSMNKCNKIGICIRNDKESNVNPNFIIDYMKENNIEYDLIDTVIDNVNNEFDNLVINKIKEFSGYKLIITDRLHGMIFTYLSKTKCVAFDNSNKKVSGVYEWIKDSTGIKYSTDINDFKIYFNELLENENPTFIECKESFNELKEELIRKG